MTDLTEQLYAGTLPTGHYYFNNGVETYIVLYSNANTKDRKMQEPSGLTVISKVPSYEEWEQTQNWGDFTKDYHELREKLEIAEYENAELKERLKKTQELELEVRRENAQLKELLKECKEMLKKSITYQCMDRANHYIKKIENDIYEPTLAKIDEVLK